MFPSVTIQRNVFQCLHVEHSAWSSAKGERIPFGFGPRSAYLEYEQRASRRPRVRRIDDRLLPPPRSPPCLLYVFAVARPNATSHSAFLASLRMTTVEICLVLVQDSSWQPRESMDFRPSMKGKRDDIAERTEEHIPATLVRQSPPIWRRRRR